MQTPDIDTQDLFPHIYSETPNNNASPYLTWSLPSLFKINTHGKWLIWQVMFDGTSNRLVTLHGQFEGNLIRNEKQVTLNKSGRNMAQQAMSEASSRYNKKLDGGYIPYSSISTNRNNVNIPENQDLPTSQQIYDQAIISRSSIDSKFKVMLSQEYNAARVARWPISAEPKFDGIRAYSKPDLNSPNGIALKSRNHKDFPWSNHVRTQLASFFRYLPQGSILDGELYNHQLTFSQISSAVRRAGKMSPDNPLLKYYIFDIFENDHLVFEDRYNLLVTAYNQFVSDGNDASSLVIVPMTMVFSDEEVKLAEVTFSSQGFEGVILRQFGGTCTGEVSGVEYIEPTTGLNIPIRFCEMLPTSRTAQSIKASQYAQKRSYNLMKYKTFKTEEGIVVDIEEGQGTREGAGIIVLQDIRGNIFRVSPQGDIGTHSEWLRNKERYIGKPYTFKYQELSEYGITRFPVGVGFRDYE
jgi:hypothetical protein